MGLQIQTTAVRGTWLHFQLSFKNSVAFTYSCPPQFLQSAMYTDSLFALLLSTFGGTSMQEPQRFEDETLV